MKILITGAAGHIGSYLVRKLKKKTKKKIQIIFLDNFLSNNYNSLFELENKTSFFNIDLSSCKIRDIPFSDIVIHLAAKTDATQRK